MALLKPHNNFREPSGENISRSRKLRDQARAFFCVWLMVLAGLGINTSRAQAISHEYEIKAVFLFNFAQFTDWPTNAFENDTAPFVIGVLGSDPFGGVLETTVQSETINGRKFAIKHFSTAAQATNCQILFISRSENRRLEKILTDLKGLPILTVSDIDNAAYRGACVRFITENNKIRLRINTDSVRDAGLVMSSKLLRIAELIPAAPK